MKCPKCGYIGFESADKCRNCGYDFSLVAEPEKALDLPLRIEEPVEAPRDIPLSADATPRRASPRGRPRFDASDLTPIRDLPLFGADAATPPSRSSRPPIADPRPASVSRRPAAPRATPTPAPPLPIDVPLDLEAVPEPLSTPRRTKVAGRESAGTIARAIAALLDLAILLALDGAVLYFTLRVCRLTSAEIAILPFAPFVAFLLVMNGGYLVGFTAVGGQTIGKMAAGIKVIGEDGVEVAPGQALVRGCGYLVSLLSAGIGFLPGLVGPSRRAVHDRLAKTRVVRLH